MTVERNALMLLSTQIKERRNEVVEGMGLEELTSLKLINMHVDKLEDMIHAFRMIILI